MNFARKEVCEAQAVSMVLLGQRGREAWKGAGLFEVGPGRSNSSKDGSCGGRYLQPLVYRTRPQCKFQYKSALFISYLETAFIYAIES